VSAVIQEPESVPSSGLPGDGDLIDAGYSDAEQYVRLMRRIGLAEDAGTPVSAFNSSI
jgi:hypothetical protein